MRTPDVPDPFPDFNTVVLPAGRRLVRVHDPAFGGAAFNPCKGGITRFAPLALPSGECLPTLYAADDYECALFETVFHDVAFDARPAFVALRKVISRAVSEIVTASDLRLANLREADLNGIGLTRGQIVDTLAGEYHRTGRWAEAFHRKDERIAGLAWTSRRCDPQSAYVLFGDRVSAADLSVASTVCVRTSPDLLAQARQAGRRAGITLSV